MYSTKYELKRLEALIKVETHSRTLMYMLNVHPHIIYYAYTHYMGMHVYAYTCTKALISTVLYTQAENSYTHLGFDGGTV